MRWGRGFFRAWIVLSVIWIGLSVYYFGPTPYRWWSPRLAYEFQKDEADPITAVFDPSKSQAQLTDDVIAAIKDAAAKSVNVADREVDLSKTKPELAVADIARAYDQMKQKTRTAWLFTLTPPLALLGLGLCITWILRGFRPAT